MSRATLGSALMFRCLVLPMAVFTKIVSPSRSTQTGVTCGEPSLIKVARFAKFFPSIRFLAKTVRFLLIYNSHVFYVGHLFNVNVKANVSVLLLSDGKHPSGFSR